MLNPFSAARSDQVLGETVGFCEWFSIGLILNFREGIAHASLTTKDIDSVWMELSQARVILDARVMGFVLQYNIKSPLFDALGVKPIY